MTKRSAYHAAIVLTLALPGLQAASAYYDSDPGELGFAVTSGKLRGGQESPVVASLEDAGVDVLPLAALQGDRGQPVAGSGGDCHVPLDAAGPGRRRTVHWRYETRVFGRGRAGDKVAMVVIAGARVSAEASTAGRPGSEGYYAPLAARFQEGSFTDRAHESPGGSPAALDREAAPASQAPAAAAVASGSQATAAQGDGMRYPLRAFLRMKVTPPAGAAGAAEVILIDGGTCRLLQRNR